MNIIDRLYQYRFIIFLVSLCAILFGNLLMPQEVFEDYFAPTFLIINILTGLLLIYKNHKKRYIFIGILIIIFTGYLIEGIMDADIPALSYTRFGIMFLFFGLVTLEVISQVWHSKEVDRTVILGLVSGYICLGLLGYFLFLSIELIDPGSYAGSAQAINSMDDARQNLLYFSFITLMTIGYGEIVPLTELAKNAAILLGLLGQFYMVVITAIVVGKFVSQNTRAD